MAKVLYTHEWSLLLRLAKIFGALFLCAFIADTIIGVTGVKGILETIIFAVTCILGTIGLMTLGYCFGSPFATLSTYLYVRINLRTPIKLKEAKALKFFFEPNETGQWYPMRHLRKSPKEMRRRILFEFVQKISEQEVNAK